MPLNKYDLFAIYNDLIARGNSPLEAVNKISINEEVEPDEFYDMDETFLCGTLHDMLETNPFLRKNENPIDPLNNQFGLDDKNDFNGGNNNSDPFNPFGGF